MEKFHVYEVNPIENFIYLANKIPNAANAKKSWHLVDSKNKSAEDDNQNDINNEVNKSTNKSFKDKINTNKL